MGTLLFIIGYFLIIEILDRTLRDKIRAERITGGTVIGAYPRAVSYTHLAFTRPCSPKVGLISAISERSNP